MKKLLLSIIGSIVISLSLAQTVNYNLKDGYMAEGYDVVAYFSNKALEGKKIYSTTYDGAKYKFSSQTNLTLFKENPAKYSPQYGGWCAYAIGAKKDKVSINPETFEIRNGKLYLFYNAWFMNTLKYWLEEGAEALRTKADTNWEQIKFE